MVVVVVRDMGSTPCEVLRADRAVCSAQRTLRIGRVQVASSTFRKNKGHGVSRARRNLVLLDRHAQHPNGDAVEPLDILALLALGAIERHHLRVKLLRNGAE